jgi:hypothetical protein
MAIPIHELEAEALNASPAGRARLLERLIENFDRETKVITAWLAEALHREQKLLTGDARPFRSVTPLHGFVPSQSDPSTPSRSGCGTIRRRSTRRERGESTRRACLSKRIRKGRAELIEKNPGLGSVAKAAANIFAAKISAPARLSRARPTLGHEFLPLRTTSANPCTRTNRAKACGTLIDGRKSPLNLSE